MNSGRALRSKLWKKYDSLKINIQVSNIRCLQLPQAYDTFAGLSRQFCFAQFKSLADAKNFLERHHPSIKLYGAYNPSDSDVSDGTKIRISYSREKADRDQAGKNEEDWKCEVVSFAWSNNRCNHAQ
jgi:hypothetical protein